MKSQEQARSGTRLQFVALVNIARPASRPIARNATSFGGRPYHRPGPRRPYPARPRGSRWRHGSIQQDSGCVAIARPIQDAARSISATRHAMTPSTTETDAAAKITFTSRSPPPNSASRAHPRRREQRGYQNVIPPRMLRPGRAGRIPTAAGSRTRSGRVGGSPGPKRSHNPGHPAENRALQGMFGLGNAGIIAASSESETWAFP